MYFARKVLMLVAAGAFLVSTSVAMAQLSVGTASGGSVVNGSTNPSGTQVVAGPSQMNLYTEGGSPSANSWTNFGINKVKVDSTWDGYGAAAVVDLGSAYAGSYWGDVLNFTGGVGSFRIGFIWALDGYLWDEDGTVYIETYPALIIQDGEATAGEAWVRWRTYYFSNLDLSSLQLEGEDPGGWPLDMFQNEDGGLLRFANRYPTAYVYGVGFVWSFGTPLPIGSLLEVFAGDGGKADFYGTGRLDEIVVPEGTVVRADSGHQYNIRYVPNPDVVPEPSALAMAAVFGLLVGGMVLRRRK